MLIPDRVIKKIMCAFRVELTLTPEGTIPNVDQVADKVIGYDDVYMPQLGIYVCDEQVAIEEFEKCMYQALANRDPGKYELAGTFNLMYSCDQYDIDDDDYYDDDIDDLLMRLNEDDVDTESVEFEDSNICNLRIEKLS